MLESWQRDILDAWRLLARAPAFTVAVVLTLAIGIGAATAMVTVVNGVLLSPLSYPASGALVRIVHAIGGVDQPYFSDAIYLTYAENTQTLEDLGVWSPGETATVTGVGDPEEVRTLTASRGVLTTLGVTPEIGRWFSTADDSPGAPDTVMLTNGYWHHRFGGDHAVLEHMLVINSRPHQIIGVMPAEFGFGDAFEILLPLRIDPGAPIASFRLLGVARLRPGVTLAQANADAARVLRTWLHDAGQTDPAFLARYQPALRPLKEDVVGDVGRTLWFLMGAASIVLLLACANVANLLLVRAESRRSERAIRAALGASTTRIARPLLLESVTLALLGGVAGAALASMGLRALVAIGPANLPRLSDISIDGGVLAAAGLASVLSGLLFGIVPVVKHARPRLADAAGAGGRTFTLARERHRTQQALLTVQMALAIVLLVAAGLMIRSVSALRRVDPGFTRPAQLQTFSVFIPPTSIAEPEGVIRTQQQILQRIAALPGVESAAFTTRLPMGGDRASTALLVEGRTDEGRTPPNHQVKIVSPRLFTTQGTPLVAGRDFTWADVHARREVAIVSENLARELWGSPPAALGRRIREYYDQTAPWLEVVGVAADVHDDGVHQPAPATIYWPTRPDERLLGMSGYQARRVSVAIRTGRAGTEPLLREMRDAVSTVSPMLALARVGTLDDLYRQSMARASFALAMLTMAGATALLLGISGLYGVVAYAVSTRRREIGIRLALGARASDVRALFVRRGLAAAALAIAIGLGAAAAVTRTMQSLLFGTSPLDPATFAAMPLLLVAVVVLACYLPARRASMVDPIETLREG